MRSSRYSACADPLPLSLPSAARDGSGRIPPLGPLHPLIDALSDLDRVLLDLRVEVERLEDAVAPFVDQVRGRG